MVSRNTEGKATKQSALLLRSSVTQHIVAHLQVTDRRLALELVQALFYSSTYADGQTVLSFLYDLKPVSGAKGLQFLKGFECIKTQPVLFQLNLWVKTKPKPKTSCRSHTDQPGPKRKDELIMNSDIFPLLFLLKEAFVIPYIMSSAIRRNITYTRGSPCSTTCHIYPKRKYKVGKDFKTILKAELKPHDSFPWVRIKSKPNMVAYPFNTSTLETEADASLFESSLVYVRVSGQAQLYTETLCPAKIFKLF